MAHVIAVAGKGGVGKTTLCGMLIQYLCEKGKGPILAVDADANSNPVSYTHLDVYKRQLYALCRNRVYFCPNRTSDFQNV